MSDRNIDVLTPLPADDAIPAALREPASALTRLIAGLCPARLDRRLADGVVPEPAGVLAVHVERLTSVRERRRVAATLNDVLGDARLGRPASSARLPLAQPAVTAAAGDIDHIAARLRGPRPVRAGGVARVRLLLADGAGPLYRMGRRGDLAAALRSALAAL